MTNPTTFPMQPNIIVNKPRDLEDMAAILDLYPTKPDHEKSVMLEQSLRPEYAASQNDQRIILLARKADLLIGTVQIVFENPNEEPALLADNSAVIHHLRVHPDYRGLGIGSQLMAVAESEAIRRGRSQLTLGVELDNAIAHNMYQKLGYIDFLTYKGSHDEAIIGMKKPISTE